MRMQLPTSTPSPWPAIGALSTLIGTLLTILVTWLRDRSADDRRTRAIDEASKYLEFLRLYQERASAIFEEKDQETLKKDVDEKLRMVNRYVNSNVIQYMSQSIKDRPVAFEKQRLP